jgi:hypothetical protein
MLLQTGAHHRGFVHRLRETERAWLAACFSGSDLGSRVAAAIWIATLHHLDKRITGQLAELGLKTSDIAHVALSHTNSTRWIRIVESGNKPINCTSRAHADRGRRHAYCRPQHPVPTPKRCASVSIESSESLVKLSVQQRSGSSDAAGLARDLQSSDTRQFDITEPNVPEVPLLL